MEQFIGTVGASPTLLPSSGGRPSGSYFVPLANGSRADCVTYVTPPVQVVGANGEGQASYECSAVAKAYGVSLSDLLAWNPGVNQTGGFNYPCELLGTLRYCVQPVPIIAPDSTANCSFTAVADPGWSCERYANRYNITVAALVAWNPSVGDKCTGFRGGMLPVPFSWPCMGKQADRAAHKSRDNLLRGCASLPVQGCHFNMLFLGNCEHFNHRRVWRNGGKEQARTSPVPGVEPVGAKRL